MSNWFDFKKIFDVNQRTFGFMLRFLGIDFTMLIMGWVSDWKLIDFRIPVNYGIYLQGLFLLLSIGRLPSETYEED